MKVSFKQAFIKKWVNFPKTDKEKIKVFIKHVEDYGLNNLPGKNKSSEDVDTENHNFIQDVKFAQLYNLWHYHIGIPSYDTTKSKGEWTSKYILHYQLFEDEIIIVEMNYHPPFEFPSDQDLE